MKRLWLAVAAAGMSIAGTAEAQTIINASFEGPTTTYGTGYAIGSTIISGWTVVANDGSTVDNGRNVALVLNGAYGLSTPFGVQFADLTGYSDSAPYAGLAQTIATVANHSYAVTFWLGASLTESAYLGPVSVKVSSGGDYTVFANDSTTTNLTASNMIWTQETYDFTAAGASTTLSIIGNSTTGGAFLGLDNVSIADVSGQGAVPEAATWAMMILGMGAVGYAMRRGKVATRMRFA